MSLYNRTKSVIFSISLLFLIDIFRILFLLLLSLLYFYKDVSTVEKIDVRLFKQYSDNRINTLIIIISAGLRILGLYIYQI